MLALPGQTTVTPAVTLLVAAKAKLKKAKKVNIIAKGFITSLILACEIFKSLLFEFKSNSYGYFLAFDGKTPAVSREKVIHMDIATSKNKIVEVLAYAREVSIRHRHAKRYQTSCCIGDKADDASSAR